MLTTSQHYYKLKTSKDGNQTGRDTRDVPGTRYCTGTACNTSKQAFSGFLKASKLVETIEVPKRAPTKYSKCLLASETVTKPRNEKSCAVRLARASRGGGCVRAEVVEEKEAGGGGLVCVLSCCPKGGEGMGYQMNEC